MFSLFSAECHQNYAPAVPGSHRAGPCGPGGAPHGRRECGRPRCAAIAISGRGEGVKSRTYRHTPCGVRSVPVCLDLNNSKPFSNGRGRKFRRSGVSQSEEFVTGGDPPMGATSQRRACATSNQPTAQPSSLYDFTATCLSAKFLPPLRYR